MDFVIRRATSYQFSNICTNVPHYVIRLQALVSSAEKRTSSSKYQKSLLCFATDVWKFWRTIFRRRKLVDRWQYPSVRSMLAYAKPSPKYNGPVFQALLYEDSWGRGRPDGCRSESCWCMVLHICVPIPLTNKISHHGRVIQGGVIVQRTFRGTQHNPLSWNSIVLHTSQTGCLALPLGLTAPVLLQGWEWRELGFQKPLFSPRQAWGSLAGHQTRRSLNRGETGLSEFFP